MNEPDTAQTKGGRRRRKRVLVAVLVIGTGLAVVVPTAMSVVSAIDRANTHASSTSDDAPSGADRQPAHTELVAGEDTKPESSGEANSEHHDHDGSESAPTDEVIGHSDAAGVSPEGWVQAAEGFGRTFTNIDLGDAWHEAVSAWMTEDQAARYVDVPVDHIPTGTLIDTEVSDPAGNLFTWAHLTYDTGLVLDVGLTFAGGRDGWLVATVMPGDSD